MILKKQHACIFLMSLILSLGGCTGTGDTEGHATPEGIITALSGCGGFTDSRHEKNTLLTYDTNHTYISYSYQDNRLVMQHKNAVFNCCPASISAQSEIEGNTLHITETEDISKQACDCRCLYDVEIALQDIVNNHYVLTFDEAYGDDDITLMIQLENNTSGVEIFPRSYYPYGIEN